MNRALPPPARDGSITFEGVRLTNPDRVLYPDLGTTKLALAKYYAAIGDWVLPELKDRPLSLVRCPEGYSQGMLLPEARHGRRARHRRPGRDHREKRLDRHLPLCRGPGRA